VTRALSSAASAFVEAILWRAEIDGLLPGDDWQSGESVKDAWRLMLTELVDKHWSEW
jgi:hypothetical protein